MDDPRIKAIQYLQGQQQDKPPMIWKGDSAGNYNPMAKPELPSEYVPESRPYHGPEITEFPPNAAHDPFEEAATQQWREEYIRNLPPRAREMFEAFKEDSGLDWPGTDSE